MRSLMTIQTVIIACLSTKIVNMLITASNGTTPGPGLVMLGLLAVIAWIIAVVQVVACICTEWENQ